MTPWQLAAAIIVALFFLFQAAVMGVVDYVQHDPGKVSAELPIRDADLP